MATFTFQKPDKVIMIDSTESEGKFEFRPLEPGYGLTVGNALRRVLLSSLEGFATCAHFPSHYKVNQSSFFTHSFSEMSWGSPRTYLVT